MTIIIDEKNRPFGYLYQKAFIKSQQQGGQRGSSDKIKREKLVAAANTRPVTAQKGNFAAAATAFFQQFAPGSRFEVLVGIYPAAGDFPGALSTDKAVVVYQHYPAFPV